MLASSTVKVSEFFSICLHLLHESGKIIQNVYDTKDFDKKWKGKDDPVTQADIHVQTLITTGLRYFYPKIHIIGEEDVEYKGELKYDFSRINTNLIPSSLYQSMNNEFDLNDSIIWIDPLDGTLSYVDNELDAVCTLIGVSYKSRPLMGIVSEYYEKDNGNKDGFLYKPRTFFTHKDTKQVHYIYDKELNSGVLLGEGSIIPWDLKPIFNQDIEKNFRVCCTKHRVDEKMIQRIKDINGEIMQMGGSGHKLNQVILGKGDCYFYDRSGTKKWDTCAGEALLLAMGGVLTDMKGNCYDYTKDAELANQGGVLAMLDREHHKKVVKVTENYKI